MRSRRHLNVLFGLLAALLVGVASLNVVVDPYLAHGFVDLEALVPYRVRLISRIAKAEMLTRADCEVAIIGTSRAQIALDPDYPGWNGASVCNLALTGARLAEMERVFEHALSYDSIRRLVFEVGRFDRRAPHEDFSLSRFNPDMHRFEYASSLLFGASATKASLRVLRDARRSRRAPNTDRGLTRPDWSRRRGTMHDAFLWSLGHGRAAAPSSGSVYAENGAARVVRLVERARRRGVEVNLAILPQHAISLTLARDHLEPAELDRWKRELVAALDGMPPPAAELWDFTSFEGVSAERVPLAASGNQDEMLWHWDALHVRREFGNLIVDRILGSKDPAMSSFGVRLTARNVDAHLAELERQAREYTRRNAEQVQAIRAALGDGS